MRCTYLVALFLCLLGCAASVGTIMTGTPRPPIDPSTVKLYASPPSQFEDVAILTSRAGNGWTDQGQVDNAVAGLKKKAAQLGANGILIEGTGTQSSGAIATPNGSGGFTVTPVVAQVVKGRAIHVTQE